MSTSLDNYKAKSVWLIGKLIADFQFKDFHAAGVCGNGYQESMLTPELENDGIVTSPTRGIGWLQWTGQRHVAFLLWCKARNLDWRSDDANYGFLHHELCTEFDHVPSKMRATTNLTDATTVFERLYEMAGVVQMGHRLIGAKIALDAWRAAQQGQT